MAEEAKIGKEPADFPINQGLLNEALKLKEERRVLKDRLSKIEAKKGEVTPKVYERVHKDYLHRLQDLDDQLLHKKQDIDRELATLYDTRDKIQENLSHHSHILEELQFRQDLGEFDPADFKQKAKEQEDKIRRFEQVLAGVKSNIERYEHLFEGEEDLFGAHPREEMKPLSSLMEGGDEWEQEAEKAQTQPQDQEWLEKTRPSIEIQPKLTIISGKENVGKTYTVNGALTIGRSHTNQIILKDGKVSRQHVEVKVHGAECILIDLNSSNGTLINGEKVHEHLLQSNDEIQIGDFVLQYQQ